MSQDLLQGLHESLWASLRHTFNTDRVLLAVAYLVNFSAFILLLVLLPEMIAATTISIVCLLVLNGLIFLSLQNSRREVLATIQVLSIMYADNHLSKYFSSKQAVYYSIRYRLWLILQPCFLLFAIVMALAIKLAT
jgi:hypothetical protein